jgi:DNA polymerase-3 subunit delta'
VSRPLSVDVPPGAAAFDPALAPHLLPLRRTLLPLAAKPPQVLLLEGGVEEERFSLARWWAALLNCPRRDGQGPCMSCPDCLLIGEGLHRDFFAVDGRIPNKEDEETPGPVRALTIERARALRDRVGEAPHGAGYRVIVMAGLEEQSRNAAANALLKVLEEPLKRSLFVLPVAQREQLLPTLVSRAWTFTLPWPAVSELSDAEREWEASLVRFLNGGSDWFERSAARGLEAAQARGIVLLCQKALVAVLRGRPETELARSFAAGLDAGGLHALAQTLGRMQEALQYGINPGLAADALATELYALLRR